MRLHRFMPHNCIGGTLLSLAALALGALAVTVASAASDAGPAHMLPPPPGQAVDEARGNPIVASIEGRPIYLDELGRAAQNLPETMRGLPFDALYPVLMDRVIDHAALVIMARRNRLETAPEVQRDIQLATEQVLQAAYLGQQVAAQATEQAIQARYDGLYANRPTIEEVHARHILVATEAEAREVLRQLRQGADFASIARAVSKDPDASSGGDLGFFRPGQVWPGFAEVVFSLSPGQFAPDPVKNEFGWHVVKVEQRRMVAPPSLADAHDQIRQELLAAGVQQAVSQARSQLLVHRFNLDGTDLEAAPRQNAGAAADGASRP